MGKAVPLAWFEKASGEEIVGPSLWRRSAGLHHCGYGYETTIMDFSKEQLAKDRLVAEPRENLDMQTVEADMTGLPL